MHPSNLRSDSSLIWCTDHRCTIPVMIVWHWTVGLIEIQMRESPNKRSWCIEVTRMLPPLNVSLDAWLSSCMLLRQFCLQRGCAPDLQGKFSLTSFAASTFAGELRSGTSADKREITDINWFVSSGTFRQVKKGNVRQSRLSGRVTTALLHLRIPIHHPLVRAGS